MSFSNQIAADFGECKLIGLFSLALVFFGIIVQIFNNRFLLRVKHKYKIWSIALLCIGAVALMIIGKHKKNFWLMIFASSVIGMSQILGEITIIGFIKCFPPIFFSGYSSGTGASGVSGALLYFLLRVWGISFTATMLCVLIVYPIYILAFSLVTRLRLNTKSPPRISAKSNLSRSQQMSQSLLDNPEALRLYLQENSQENGNTQSMLEANEARVNFRLTWSDLQLVFSQAKGLYMLFGITFFFKYISVTSLSSLIMIRYSKEYPQDKTPFMVVYLFEILQIAYHSGIVISRSTLDLFQVRRVWIILLCQLVVTLGCFVQTLVIVTQGTWLPILSVFSAGFFGGLSYVSIYHILLGHPGIPKSHRELSITINNICGDIGIIMNGLVGYFFLFSVTGN